jgi:hypothetical protein
MVSELPLTNNRNFQACRMTVARNHAPAARALAVFNSQDSLRYEVNGSRGWRAHANRGLDDNQKTGLLQVIIPAATRSRPQHLHQQLRPEFGRSGGAVTNVTLKSGTKNSRAAVSSFSTTKRQRGDYFSHQRRHQVRNGGFTSEDRSSRASCSSSATYQRTLDNNGYVVRTTFPTWRCATAISGCREQDL